MTSSEALDVAWLLVAAALVMLMQAGFSALESGSVRSKNSINVAAKNFSDFLVSSALFWVFGFALMFGTGGGGWIGTDGFFFDDGAPLDTAFFVFQLGFVATAVTIVSGAVAERMRFRGYLLITVIVAGLLYPLFGHWAWGSADGGSSGWLESLGFIDFAGSTVVHSVGGWVALASVMIIGPRAGRFGEDAVEIRGHDLPMATVGVFILWFGWFGFNGGSTFALTDEVPSIILNTSIAAVFGGLVVLLLAWWRVSSASVPVIMNGGLAGLVGITASANIVSTTSAAVIGVVAGLAMFAATTALERLRIDDVVGAVPVHLVGGIWGTIAVALFGSTAAFGPDVGRVQQLGYQLTGVVVCCALSFGLGYVLLRGINRRFPFRIDREGERIGLNVADHAASTEILDLLTEMDSQRASSDYSIPVNVEPHTEIGQIALQYNRVLADINAEAERRRAAATALAARTSALQLLQEITTAANSAESIEAAMTTGLERVCRYMDWPVGHLYLVDDDTHHLVSTGVWAVSDQHRFAAFQAATAAAPTGAAGLPERAMAEKRPVLVFPEPESTAPRDAAARDGGLVYGFALPVLAGEEVAAVLEFFSAAHGTPDQPTLDVMASVGTQLGRVVERRRAEQERFRSVVDNMPAAVLLRDLDGRFIMVNRRYEEFYGTKNAVLRGRTPSEVFDAFAVAPDVAMTTEHDAAALAANRAVEREITLVRNGAERVLASVKFPIGDHTGRPVAVGGIELDITDRKHHEAELADLVAKVEAARDAALQATEAKSRFLANMSHELRTPLNAIIGFTRLVKRHAGDVIEVRQRENLDKILLSADNLLTLINDILDLSRIESGRIDVSPVTIDVSDLVETLISTLEPLAADKHLDLRCELGEALPPLFTDPERLRQILLNLVSNAIKFTEEGSVVVSARSWDGGLTIDVTDSGIGIAEEALDRVFDEFQQADSSTTRRYGGTGLGLAISSQLTRLLGGRLSVRSEVGVGSTFTLQLPTRFAGLGEAGG